VSEVGDVTRRMVERIPSPGAGDAEGGELWSALEASGFTGLAVDPGAGGSGGELADLGAVLVEIGRGARSMPLVEHNTACWLLAGCGIELPVGRMSITCADLTSGRKAGPVAGLRRASHVVVAEELPGGETSVALVDRGNLEIEEGIDVAGEPLDLVGPVPQSSLPRTTTAVRWTAVRSRLAFCRTAMILGAAEKVRDLTRDHASSRQQFGVPLVRFQAVQGELAALAGYVRLLRALFDDLSSSSARITPLAAVAARVFAGDVASVAFRSGHQLHGALGYTAEHELSGLTRRLAAWKEFDGSLRGWRRELGRLALDAGGAGLWSALSGLDDDRNLSGGSTG
jgi:acyl-CoA dehydrogenase